jgi:hypothetical protein
MPVHLSSRQWAASIGFSLLVLTVLPPLPTASAFCRSTTCRGADCQHDERGCPASGHPLFWPTSCVGLSFQKDLTAKLAPEQTRAAVHRALDSWAQARCPGNQSATLSFQENEDTACSTSEFDVAGPNVNVILFRDDDFPYRDQDNTLGKTTVTFDPNTGAILDADIEINTAFNEVTTDDRRVVYDLESIMAHELGHFLGFAHSDVKDATMYASYATGSTGLRSLDPDDVAAICEVYPPGRQAQCQATPTGGQKICQGADVDPPQAGCFVGKISPPAAEPPEYQGMTALAAIAAIAALARRSRRAEHRSGS